jgi:hypothetical protein
MSIFLSLGLLSKNPSKSDALFDILEQFYFLRRGIVSPTPNPKAWGPPLVGSPRLPFPPSSTSGCSMPWWQGTHISCFFFYTVVYLTIVILFWFISSFIDFTINCYAPLISAFTSTLT